MYKARRPRLRSSILILLAASFVIAACGTQGINTNWAGLSSDGETVYVAYGPEVMAYDVATQREKWSHPTEPDRAVSYYAAPDVSGNRIVFGDYGKSGGFLSPGKVVSLYAYEEVDALPSPLWQQDGLAQDSIIASPLQVDDRVFVGTANGQVFALDGRTGSPLWQEPFVTEGSIWGKLAFKDGTLFVNSLDRTVYAIDAESGNERWHKQLDGALASAPVVNMDLVYVASFDHRLYALDIETGAEEWVVMAEDWIWGAPVYHEGVVYFADAQGNVFAVDAESGEGIWSREIGRPVQTSPVINGESLYIGSQGDLESETEQGMLTALRLSDGEVMWQVSAPAPIYATPVVVDDMIVVAQQSATTLLTAFDQETGVSLWSIAPPDRSS